MIATTNFTMTKGAPENANAEEVIEELQKEAKQETHKLDKIAVVVLPLLFFAFNIAYWLHYMG